MVTWAGVRNVIGSAAPLIGTLLGGPLGATAGGMIAQALGCDAEPSAVEAALRNDPELLVRLKVLESEHERDLRRMVLESETARLGEINRTMRAEAASDDPYVRRWRPTFGYSVAFTWTVQALGIVGACMYALQTPEHAGTTLNALSTMIGALSIQWGTALAVLGINVVQRSNDKAVQAGSERAPGLLSALATKISSS